MKIIDSFNSRSSTQPERFRLDQLETNETGDEVCLTRFTSLEKRSLVSYLPTRGLKFGEL